MNDTCDCNENQMILGSGELFFSRGSKTAAQAQANGFEKFCSIDEVGIEPSSETKEKMGACRGVKRKVKTVTTMASLKYKLKLNELGPKQLGLLYFADPTYFNASENSNKVAALADSPEDIVLSTQDCVGGTWYPVMVCTTTRYQASDIINVDTVTSSASGWSQGTALVEGTDYVLDRKLGMIKFSKNFGGETINAMVTTSPVANAAGSGSFAERVMLRLRAFSQATHKGIFRLFIFDDDKVSTLALKHVDFYGEIKVSSGPTFGDDFATIEVEVEVLDTAASDVFVRPDLNINGLALNILP